MVTKNRVISLQGTSVPIKAETICLHGDGASAVEFARHIRYVLEHSGIAVKKLAECI
jgi:5-oxoprolinase (ATP-hydrolysing) subunit A